MEFQSTQPIFMQIFDLICDMMLKGELKAGDQVPSVRDLAMRLQVNPNTVMRAIERLAFREVIQNKRGVGYFVTETALDTILAMRHHRLIEERLPQLAEEMRLLNISVEEVAEKLRENL